MKILLTAGLLFSLLAENSVMAQSNKTSNANDVKGANFLNAGIGLGTYGLADTGGLPITASFEHGFTKNISAGIVAGFIQRKFDIDWKYTYLIFGARGSYHFNELLKITNPKLDVYGGAGLIHRHFSSKFTDVNTGDNPNIVYKSSGAAIDFDLHAGGRYFFNEHLGAYAELGYGISPLQLGVTFKF